MLAYLEKDFYAVDEKEDDYDEHEAGVAAGEDMLVKLSVLVFDPNEEEFAEKERIRNYL